MTSLSEQFCAEVESFLERASMDPTKLGKDALNDPNFVFDLREGRSPSARTIDKVRSFIARHAPSKGAAA